MNKTKRTKGTQGDTTVVRKLFSKKLAIMLVSIGLVASLGSLAIGCSGQDSGTQDPGSQSEQPTQPAKGSILAIHASNVSFDLDEATAVSCLGSGCHTHETIATATANYLGVDEINPHQSHLGELVCSKCHSMGGEPTLACNECHFYEVPNEWIDPSTVD